MWRYTINEKTFAFTERLLKLYDDEFVSGHSIQFHDPNEFWEVFPIPTLDIIGSLELKRNHVESPKLAHLPKRHFSAVHLCFSFH